MTDHISIRALARFSSRSLGTSRLKQRAETKQIDSGCPAAKSAPLLDQKSPIQYYQVTHLIVLTLVAAFIYPPLQAEEPGTSELYRPTPGQFADPSKAVAYRGELVFVDHVNRRGTLRLHVDNYFREDRLHPFAMLPYGCIYYRGAPAELRDIPIGTNLYGQFYLPPNAETSLVPVINKPKLGKPAENYVLLLEDDLSKNLREGKAWQLNDIEIQGDGGTLNARFGEKDHALTIDHSTRIWRGKELLGIQDLLNEGTWKQDGRKQLNNQSAHLALGWHPRYLYQQFHVADLWLDNIAVEVAKERQRQIHIRHIRYRWLPAKVTAVDYDQFGHGTVTAVLHGGMDQRLYDAFKPKAWVQMCAAESTLRTWWQNHDGMEGEITAVNQNPKSATLGNSGIEIEFSTDLILEGFRPGRTVRLRASGWPSRVKPPTEEQIKGPQDRWPSPSIFVK